MQFSTNRKQFKTAVIAECSVGHSAVLFSWQKVILLCSDICCASYIAFGSYGENKILLNRRFNNTFVFQKYNSAIAEYHLKNSKFRSIIIAELYMADSIMRDKSKEFAKEIVFLCRELKATHRESVLVGIAL